MIFKIKKEKEKEEKRDKIPLLFPLLMPDKITSGLKPPNISVPNAILTQSAGVPDILKAIIIIKVKKNNMVQVCFFIVAFSIYHFMDYIKMEN